jgi:E3 ubiquitin-protein ligase UBR4
MTTAWRRGLGPEEIDADATRRARDDGDDDDGDARREMARDDGGHGTSETHRRARAASGAVVLVDASETSSGTTRATDKESSRPEGRASEGTRGSELQELVRALRRSARARGRLGKKMVSHALAPHCVKALIARGERLEEALGEASTSEARDETLRACEATVATFTTHPDALRGALQDDYDVVRDMYCAVVKMAVFSLERLDARDVDAAASWSDVLRACVSRGYAERWSVTIVERLRTEDERACREMKVDNETVLSASDESALMSALAEPVESVDGAIVGETSRVTSPTDTLIVDLYRAILDVCVSILRQKLTRATPSLAILPRMLAQLCLEVMSASTDARLIEAVCLECERACTFLGSELNLDECGFVKDIVSTFVTSSEWTHLTDNTSCALSNALYSVTISNAANWRIIEEAFALFPRKRVAASVMKRLCSADLDVRDCMVKLLEASISDDNVNDETHGCVTSLLSMTLDDFPEAFLLDKRFDATKASKLILDSALLTLIRLGLSCRRDGAQTIAACLIASLERAKMLSQDDDILRFIAVVRFISFVLRSDSVVDRGGPIATLAEQLTSTNLHGTSHSQESQQREDVEPRQDATNNQRDLAELFAMPETLMEDNPSDELLERRLARLDAVLDAAVAPHGADEPTEPESGGRTLPELWGRLIGSEENHLRERILLVSGTGENETDTNSLDEDRLNISSGLCTFVTSGESFQEQHWYFCYDCNLVASRGCCSNCAKTCHAGHRVVYSRKSRFFCDCGADGASPAPRHKCFCLSERDVSEFDDERRVAGERNSRSFEINAESDSEGEDEMEESQEPNLARRLCSTTALKELKLTLERAEITEKLEGVLISWFRPLHESDSASSDRFSRRDASKSVLVMDESMVTLPVARNFKAGSFEMEQMQAKVKVQELLFSGVVVRNGAACSRDGHLAIAEGDKISILDANVVVGAQSELSESKSIQLGDKVGIRPLSRNLVDFEIIKLEFNHMRKEYLSVTGLHHAQVFTLSDGGEILDRLPIQVPESIDLIIDASWVPSSTSLFSITGRNTCAVYDLSRNTCVPACTIQSTTPITSAVWINSRHKNRLCALLTTEDGTLHAFYVKVTSKAKSIQLDQSSKVGVCDKVRAVTYSQCHGIAIVHSSAGEIIFTRVSVNTDEDIDVQILKTVEVCERKPSKVFDFCLPNKPGPDATLLMPKHVFMQAECIGESIALLAVGDTKVDKVVAETSTASIVGYAGYQKTGSGDFPSSLIVLRSDGSMQIHTYSSVESLPTPKTMRSDERKNGIKTKEMKFAYNFFEKLTRVTSSVDFGGSFNRGSTPAVLRSILQSEDGSIASPSSIEAYLTLELPDDNRIIRGIRIYIGGITMQSYTPSKLVLPGGRIFTFERETKRWYDIPFTCAESKALKDSVHAPKFKFSVDSMSQVSICIHRMEVYACDGNTLEEDLQAEQKSDVQHTHDTLASSASRARRHLIRDDGLDDSAMAWLSGTISIIQALRYCKLDLKSSKLRICYEAMLRKKEFITLQTPNHKYAKFVAWKVLRAQTRDTMLTVMHIKDNSTLLFGHKVTERICPRIHESPFSIADADLFEYFCAVRKLGRLALRRPRTLLDSSPYLSTLANTSSAMLDVAAEAWDANEIIPSIVHALVAVLIHEHDAEIVKSMVRLVTCTREDVRDVATETLLWHLLTTNSITTSDVNPARRIFAPKVELRNDKCAASSGIRQLVSSMMQVKKKTLYKSQITLIRTLSEAYPECLNLELCKLPPLHGDILAQDAICSRLAIAAECMQLQDMPTSEAREALLHTYALACEFLRCLDVRETDVYPSEKGYGALLQSEENARNREQRIIHCLQSVLLYASAHSRSFALSKLPEREKSEWSQVLARISAMKPKDLSSQAIFLLKQFLGDDDIEIRALSQAGRLFNLSKALREIVTADVNSHWLVDEVPYSGLQHTKETVDRFLEVAIDNKRSLKLFYENIDFAPELVGALMMAASNLPAPISTNICKVISCTVESCNDGEPETSVTKRDLLREIIQGLDIMTHKCALAAVEDDTRAAAAHVLKTIWYSFEHYRDDVLVVLMSVLESSQNHGHRGSELMEFAKGIMLSDSDVVSLYQNSINKFCHGMRDVLLRVSDHPRADLYRALKQQQILGSDSLDRYWLEKSPSARDAVSYLACHRFSAHSLDSLKKNQTFTKNTAFSKLREAMTIESISMNVTELKSHIRVKEVEVWRTTSRKDLSVLRAYDCLSWQFLGVLYFPASANEAELKFEIPVDASALKIVFRSFHENLQAKMTMALHCPRCARLVTDVKHGICTNCRENAYQCRYCRNINYEKLDAFICNECGYCRYAKIQTTLSAHATLCLRHPKLQDAEDLSDAVQELKAQSQAIAKILESIESAESSIRTALFERGDSSEDVERMFSVTSKGRRMDLVAARCKCDSVHDAILQYLPTETDEDISSSPPGQNDNYGTCRDYLFCALKLCTSLSRTPAGMKALSGYDIHQHLFNRMLNPHVFGLTCCSTVRTILSNMAAANEDVARFLCNSALERAGNALLSVNTWQGSMISQNNQDVLLLKDLVHVSTYRVESGMSEAKGAERAALMSLACKAITSKQLVSNAVVVENTVLPALEFVRQAMTNSSTLKEILTSISAFSEFESLEPEAIGEETPLPKTVQLIPWLAAALNCGSRFVRHEVVQVFSILLRNGDEINVQIANFMLGTKPNLDSEPYSDFLSVLSLALCSETIISRVNESNKLSVCLLSMLQRELDANSKYTVSERALFASTNQDTGVSLHSVSMLLRDIFAESSSFMERFVTVGLEAIVRAVLYARALQICQSPAAIKASETFDALLSLIIESSGSLQPNIAKVCLKLAQIHVSGVPQEPKLPLQLILNELAYHVLPRAPPLKVYLLRMLKSPTQEEFIPGVMSRNPYSTANMSAKPLMRDVKNLICRELDMVGLVEDDFGMELLVTNQIISLDLPVEDVFERIWLPSLFQDSRVRQSTNADDAIGPPMPVTFRLSGLDGEATEQRIDELPPTKEEDEDIELKFAGTTIFQQGDGFSTLIELLPRIRRDTSVLYTGNEDVFAKLLEILRSACYLKKNRRDMLEIGALEKLLDETAQAFTRDCSHSGKEFLLVIEMLLREEQEETMQSSEGEVSAPTMKSGILSRELVESASMSKRPGSPMLIKNSSSLQAIEMSVRENEMNHVEIFLSQLKQLIQSQERHEADILARVIPRLAGSTTQSTTILVKNFDASVRKLVQLHGHEENSALKLELECSARLAEAIPMDQSGHRVLEAVWSEGTVNFVIDFIINDIFKDSDGRIRGTQAWTSAIKEFALPIALEILNGITRGYRLDLEEHAEVIDLLHHLESVIEHDIGSFAENCLETFASASEIVARHLDDLRAATREENRRKALAKREQMLCEMGMQVVANSSSPGASTIGVSRSPRSLQGYTNMVTESEQESIVCRVCFEGYKLKPSELLGIYCFNKLTNTPYTSEELSQTLCTVSHFNAIHFSCHQSAKRADVALRTPKREWEGAALRNSETLCNNLLPVMGEMIADTAYISAVDTWWQNCFAVGAFISPPTRARQVAVDISLLLGRFAMNVSFSTDCRGGGRESNMNLLPHMMRLLLHQVSLCPQKGLEEYNALLTRLSCDTDLWNDPDVCHLQLLPAGLVLSITIWSNEQWEKARQNVLIAIVRHAKKYECTRIASYSSGDDAAADASWNELDATERFKRLKPILIYFGLINKMYEWLKPKQKPQNAMSIILSRTRQKATDVSQSESLSQRLCDIASMLDGAKDTLEWLDEVEDAEDAQELLDICECLADAMCPTVDGFFARALESDV